MPGAREREFDLWLALPSGYSVLIGHVTARTKAEARERIDAVVTLLWRNNAKDVGVWLDDD